MKIFLFVMEDLGNMFISGLLAELLAGGIEAEFTNRTLKDLHMQVDRVARYVEKNPADAWVVVAASREVLEWFSRQPTPAMALFGVCGGVPISAVQVITLPCLSAIVRRLIALGHRRIVMVSREERRSPRLALSEQAFLKELEAAGIKTGPYNLPDWLETPKGLNQLLDELFRVSPPTALILHEASIFIAARSHLTERGIIAPRNVSLVVLDDDPSLAWCEPTPAHLQWDRRSAARHIVRWAKKLALGKRDFRKYPITSKFAEGGTIGPAP